MMTVATCQMRLVVTQVSTYMSHKIINSCDTTAGVLQLYANFALKPFSFP